MLDSKKEDPVKYLCNYAWTASSQQTEAIRRFKETGGQPPKGVTLLGRWTRADFMGGVVLLESEDARALTQFSLAWSDVMSLQIVPVVDDKDLMEVLERSGG